MDEEHFNMQMRKFLKKVGVTSQTEMEKAIRSALYDGKLKPDATVKAVMTLEIPALGIRHQIDSLISLEDEGEIGEENRRE